MTVLIWIIKTLLTLSADEAVRINIADNKANSIEEIIKLKNMNDNYEIITVEEEKYDTVLKFLLNPFVLSILISIGIAWSIFRDKNSRFRYWRRNSNNRFSCIFSLLSFYQATVIFLHLQYLYWD
ncbi:hypothetical protein OGZ02_13550 [Brachyspira hyodysenteriae]|nr:hypothetical protein [Brachyspira hyodysenteriae]MDA1469826.1 hypothetical protein [Brachyspira hyodysenteriae]